MSVLLTDFLDHVFARQRLAGKSGSTKRQYRMQLGHFARFLAKPPTLEDLTDDNLSCFLAWIVDNGRSPATANKARNHLLSLWRFAARKRHVEQWPEVPALIEPERIPLAWSLDQLSSLYRACAAETGTIAGIPAGAWWTALHRVWFDSGERCGAALLITWNNLDLDGQWLVVPAEVRKGKRKELLYRLKPATVASLRAIRLPERKLVFPWPWCVATFYNRYGKLLARAGLPTDRRSKPQRMRRSFASHLEANGGNATEALSHSSRNVTRRSYLDPRICSKQHPSDLLPDVPP